MDILIIGGTKFLGRALVDVAKERGHNITLFNRGVTNPELYPELTKINGDRDGEINKLGERKWDAVIDTCGYVPRIVQQSVEFLQNKIGSYVFISTISVYTESSEMYRDESAEVTILEDKNTEDIRGAPENYGGLKYLCEEKVKQTCENSIIIRPGLIVGPYDPTNRFTYWPVRIRRGGKVLINDDDRYPVQIIDVRDLAKFTIHLIENSTYGTFNVTGPAEYLSISDVLQECQSVTKSDAAFVKVSDQFLLDNEIKPWMELPLWIPSEEGRALMSVRIQKAISSGLTFRPLKETIIDTLQWYDEIQGDNLNWDAGLKSDKEMLMIKKHLS